jgi:hypothetical protein
LVPDDIYSFTYLCVTNFYGALVTVLNTRIAGIENNRETPSEVEGRCQTSNCSVLSALAEAGRRTKGWSPDLESIWSKGCQFKLYLEG